MKIASPLSKPSEVAPLAKAGANEFYCGVAPESWRSTYGMVESISRRNNPFAHLSSYRELEKVLCLSRKYEVKVHVALNEVYHKEQLEFLLEQVRILNEMGVDGIILGDIAPLLAIRKAKIRANLFMGTGGAILNSETVKLYRELGVSRMILSRHLSVKEIREIISNAPGVEYEVFIFRGLCPFIDGFCRFQHGINETLGRKPRVDLACSLKFRIRCGTDFQNWQSVRRSEIGTHNMEIGDSDRIKRVKRMMSPRQSLTGCGLCALYDFARIKGVTSLKIVGREFSSREKLENLRIVKRFLDILQCNPSISRADFIKSCKQGFIDFFGRECGYKDCYYPEFFPDKPSIEERSL